MPKHGSKHCNVDQNKTPRGREKHAAHHVLDRMSAWLATAAMNLRRASECRQPAGHAAVSYPTRQTTSANLHRAVARPWCDSATWQMHVLHTPSTMHSQKLLGTLKLFLTWFLGILPRVRIECNCRSRCQWTSDLGGYMKISNPASDAREEITRHASAHKRLKKHSFGVSIVAGAKSLCGILV